MKGAPPRNRREWASTTRRFATAALLAAAALSLGTVASALTVTLSEMSSDATDAGELDATLVFTDLGGGSLQLDVTNDTVAGTGFDINEIAFNLAGVTSLELDSPDTVWELNGNAANVATAPGANHIAGFGNFEFQLVVDGNANSPAEIEEGETQTFLFTYTGMLAAGILEANGSGKLVAGKFVQGPGDDSAFGASGDGAVVPEPSAALLMALGVLCFATRCRNVPARADSRA